MDNEECYAWAETFEKAWGERVADMAARAGIMGMTQEERDGALLWMRGTGEECRWVFVDDPSDIEGVRAVFAREGNVRSPSCMVVVNQPDGSDSRGDVVYDIFRLSPRSYLWHFNRVYTRPGGRSGE